MRYAFHHVAVAGDEVDVMVDDLLFAIEHRAHVRLGHRHPHRVADPLTERAGRRLDTWGVSELGMSRCLALPLSELLDVVERQIVPGQLGSSGL